MENLDPKADPQFWANNEHLDRVLREQGKEAAIEEFRKMQQGALPQVGRKHRAMAIGYRRWHHLPALNASESGRYMSKQFTTN